MILFNSQPLTDDKKGLDSYGIKDGDLVTLQQISSSSSSSSSAPAFAGLDFSSIQVPQLPQSSSSGPNSKPSLLNQDPAMIRSMLLANPDQLATLQQNNPALGKFFRFKLFLNLLTHKNVFYKQQKQFFLDR